MVTPATTPDGKIRHYISFGGVSTADYKCYVDGSGSFGAPEREYEKVSVPGRNGDLTLDGGNFKDVSAKYAMLFEDIAEFEEFKNKIKALTGPQRLEDSHHPYEYRIATLSEAIEPSVGGYLNAYCSLELELTLYPQRFLIEGESPVTVTSSGLLTNPTEFDSKPLIRVTKSGIVTINDRSFQITYVDIPLDSGSVYIDCELQDAYYISNGARVTANPGLQVTNDLFPVLNPGSNTIALSGGLSRCYITPRWWCV